MIDRSSAVREELDVELPVAAAPTPTLRLFTEPLVVDRSGGLGDDLEDLDAAVAALGFVYEGLHLAADDARERLFFSRRDGTTALARNRTAEVTARARLEQLGAVDLSCLDDYATAPGSRATHLIGLEGGRHERCRFTAASLDELRAEGWRVEIDGAYPFQVVTDEVTWTASIEALGEARPDWFGLDLGLDVGGERIDLLPIVVELLEGASKGETLRSVLRPSSKQLALPIDDRRHVLIPPEQFRALVRTVLELYEGGERIVFPAAKAAAVARLDETFRPGGRRVAWRDPADVRDRGRRLIDVPAVAATVAVPPDLRATLRPYQQHGLAFLQHLRAQGVGGVLADDMGLGKTLQTIAHLAIEHAAGRLEDRALVVAPTSLVGNWGRELERFAPRLRVVVVHGTQRRRRYAELAAANVVVTTYPVLVRDADRFHDRAWSVVVLDEAHVIKNRRSQVAEVVRGIEAGQRLCLTGTPIENHLGELWAIFDFLNPGLLGNELSFNASYRQPIEREGDVHRLEALHAQVSPYILRRLKRDVAKDLPPKTDLVRRVELEGKQRELYESIRIAAHDDVRRAIRKRGLAGSTIPILDALMKLRQVCCDPRLVPMHSARFVRESAKHEALMQLLGSLLPAGHRVLVFSQFTRMLDLIASSLDERAIPYLQLTGATRDRQRVVDAFEAGKAPVFLISLKAGGAGLNLTSADTVIHYDPWWNPAAQAQATDRAYRIGQTKPVFAHSLIVAGSVEDRMVDLQARKRKLAEAVLAGDARSLTFCEADLEHLFAPLADGVSGGAVP